MDWRLGELAVMKTIPHRYNMTENHVTMLQMYLIPAIYALWEGFVKSVITAYIKEINMSRVTMDSLIMDLLLYAIEIDDKLKLSEARQHEDKKKQFVRHFRNTLSAPVNIKQKVLTESNVNLKIINHLLKSFGLETIPEEYKGKLDKLLKFRNTIAHGEMAIVVKDEHIAEFTQLINDLMAEVVIRVEDGLIKKTYLEGGRMISDQGDGSCNQFHIAKEESM